MKNLAYTLIVPMLVIGAQTADAATATADMRVTATVARSCTIDPISDLAFGTILPTGANTATTTIAVTCTSANTGEATVSIQLDGGENVDGGVRRMEHTGETGAFVPYTLSSSGAIGVGGDVDATTTTNGQTYSVTINGAITYSPTFVVGSYLDIVGVTLTYNDAYVAP